MANIVTLLVNERRIDDLQEQRQDLLKGDLFFIVVDFNGFTRRRAVCLEVFIFWCFNVGIGVADGGFADSRDQRKIVFNAPETAARKIDRFHTFIIDAFFCKMFAYDHFTR